MQYVSTRGDATKLGFKDVLLKGLADDGGLFVPEYWPTLSSEKIRSFQGQTYPDIAFEIMSRFVDGEIPDAPLKHMIEEAYATFHHPATTPLLQHGSNHWVLELFHGPTLAFKDVAMQILARLMDYVLAERDESITIVGATSGDTGGAALHAFKSCNRVDTFFMFPDGKVSGFQRRQMTTVGSEASFALAIDGSFDNCQSIVKDMFRNGEFRDTVNLSAVNSINWGRVMAQVVYYFSAAASLGAPERTVSFVVPTGNFGDIYAGFVAKKMGLPIDRLIIATNENDILVRTLATGQHRLEATKPTNTPSMDIQISSNFERLLFEASDRSPDTVSKLMLELKTSRQYELPGMLQSKIRIDFDAGSADQRETTNEMSLCLKETGYLPDPHTAVALSVARKHMRKDVAMVTLATAHPAKFKETVEAATGTVPATPKWAVIDADRSEIVSHLEGKREVVEDFILKNSRLLKQRGQ